MTDKPSNEEITSLVLDGKRRPMSIERNCEVWRSPDGKRAIVTVQVHVDLDQLQNLESAT